MIKELLRLEDEEYIHFNELQIHDVLVDNVLEFMEYFKQFYVHWSEDKALVTLPKKQVFESKQNRGDFRVMPCIINDTYGIKSVKIIGTNEENHVINDKISVGKSFLIHPHDNYIHAMFDVCVLSSFRTAAIAILAYHLVDQHTISKIGIIGTGRIGFYTVLILCRWLGVNQFYCYDISEKSKENFLKLVELYMPGIQIDFTTIEDMGEVCDSVFVATDAEEAILDTDNSSNIRFISSVGADADNLSELDARVIEGRHILTDSYHSMMLGDLKRWKEKHIIDEKDVLELTGVLDRPNIKKEKILFISTGIAVQDALVSQFIYDKLTNG